MPLAEGIEIRHAGPEDLPGILDLARAALGWAGDARDERYLRWKHDENPAGTSPRWLAVSGGRVIGFRTFLRWSLEGPGGELVRAARAVDTATHPDAQGQGVFTRLTVVGLEWLRGDGVDLIFNTPNDRSRPGYLKMGWSVVGRPTVLVRPAGPAAALRLARARVPAEKWSLPSPGGDPAPAVLADDAEIVALLRSRPAPRGLRTRRSPAHLRWRYGLADLDYRAVTGTRGPVDGLAVFRRRRRGASVEAAVCELLAPDGDCRVERDLLRQVAAAAQADYVLRVGSARQRQGPELPLPRRGPVLTALSLNRPAPPLAGWELTLGDLELL